MIDDPKTDTAIGLLPTAKASAPKRQFSNILSVFEPLAVQPLEPGADTRAEGWTPSVPYKVGDRVMGPNRMGMCEITEEVPLALPRVSGSRFRCIVADPPWPFKWSGGGATRVNERGERHINHKFKRALPYSTMTLAQICALDVQAIADDNSVLWLWIPDRFALEGHAAIVARAWGFEPIRFLVWQKTGFGLGNGPRPAHELCLVCKRGRNIFTRRDVSSVHRWKLVYENGARKHSAKPEGFYDLVSSCTPGPYLEMFARTRRLGWESWGNEVDSRVHVGEKSLGAEVVS